MYKAFIRVISVLMLAAVALTACSERPLTEVPEEAKAPMAFEWKEAAPEQQGMDEQVLAKAEDHIKNEFGNIYSLVVIKNGNLVYERYFLDKGRETPVHVFSVTKSVISALMGIALREGYLTSMDQKLADFYPEYFSNIDDPRKKDITLRQALMMTAGFEPEDKNFYRWISSKSWFEHTLRQPLINKPGEKFNYDTGLTHLLSGVLSKATKMKTLEFANKFLFMPLGIKNTPWGTDNEGNYGGGHLLNLAPRDMAKFGYLYLKEGNWSGQQVVPKEWVKESFQKQVVFDKDSGYGYLWWINNKHDSKRNRSYMVYSALGFGGQRIDIVPELDMVAVITANPDKAPRNNGDTGEILTKFIIPSVK